MYYLLTSLRTEKHPEQGLWGRRRPPLLIPCRGKGCYWFCRSPLPPRVTLVPV